MNFEKKYHAKLMLAGEYGVIVGSEAITVPLENYYAQLASGREAGEAELDKVKVSVSGLRKLITYISTLPKNNFYAHPDIKSMETLLNEGYYINSNIPGGYGIGSSGAVSALIYDQFFKSVESLSMHQIQKDLAAIESCFHGKSSGVDAMSCYSKTALHFHSTGQIKVLEKKLITNNPVYSFFLLDSETVYDTGPLVKHFLEKMKDNFFENEIREDYFQLIRKFIRAVITGSEPTIFMIFKAISDFQYKNFKRMIPESIEEIWVDGLLNNYYYLKLNGSGGGFTLGLTHRDNRSIVEDILKDFRLIWL